MPSLDLSTIPGQVLDRYGDVFEVIGQTTLPNCRTFTMLRCRKTATVYALSSIAELRTLARQLQ